MSEIPQPEATVIVPSYGRPERLRECLGALVRLEGSPAEIVVVDDGSPEPLEPVCASFGPRVRCLRQSNAGPAAARNAGAVAATAPFLAFTDDDCRPRPDWLARLRTAHDGRDDRLVGGHVVNALADNVFSAASQSLCDYLYQYFGADTGEAPFFTTNNMAVSRAGFERLGGFDRSFTLAAAEDRDFGLRWRAAGGRLVYAPGAIVDHAHALTLRRFVRQHAGYGRGARCLHQRLEARGEALPEREPLGFYIGMLAHPFRDGHGAALPRSVLLALSQAVMIGGYLTARPPRSEGTSE